MKRILLVEDDEASMRDVKSCLEAAGFEVLTASSGQEAVQVVESEALDAMIADVCVPEINGYELAKHVKKNKPVPVILMTSLAELNNPEEAQSAGADEFLVKPFKGSDLLQALEKHLRVEDSEEQYAKIKIDDFISGMKINFDIFIRINDQKYITIAREGEQIPIERIRAYKDKDVKYLYLRKQDFRRYLGFNLTLTQAVRRAERIDKIKKLNLLKHANEVIMEQIHLEGVDEEIFASAKNLVETTVSILGDDKGTMELLSLLDAHSDYLYAHSLGVALLGAMIASRFPGATSQHIFKVSLGGLLHDIGLKEIDRSILEKPRQQFTAEDGKEYETHPVRGLEILSSVTSIPDDILQIVAQHHENCSGLGYPAKLKKDRIHPLARIVSVADAFCELALKSPHSEGMKPAEAISRLFALQENKLDGKFLSVLMSIFKAEVPRHRGA